MHAGKVAVSPVRPMAMATRNASCLVGNGQVGIEVGGVEQGQALSLAGWPLVSLEGLPSPGQGEAGVLEGLAQATAAGPPAVPGVTAYLGEGGQHPAVQVKGVGHDEGVGEQHPHGRAVGGMAVDGDDAHLGALGVAA